MENIKSPEQISKLMELLEIQMVKLSNVWSTILATIMGIQNVTIQQMFNWRNTGWCTVSGNNRAQKKIEAILKCKVEIFWDCEFKTKLKGSSKLSKFYNSIVLPQRIKLRDTALKGGRVECFRLHYKCREEEEIRYIDIVSLYPWVGFASYISFPLGNPVVYTSESFNGHVWKEPGDNKYKGFILCKVLAPQGLDLPLLAYKSQNVERSWTATYTHDELNESLLLGYIVLEIYEVWNYERWSTPGGKDDLFGKYVNTFVALKCEASGYPCKESERETYIASYMEKEGVQLNPANVQFNPGKKSSCQTYG
uniref:DNA-directed DNA polymerase n=1 Tax=Panagrolaimus superbus TaxID=310955 RepID=A0A914YAF7_9BILA